MKIWLASYPRSGNTYFRILLHHYTGWPTYSWKPERIIPEGSVTGKAHAMTAYTPGEPPDDPNVAGFMKTHEYQDDDVPAVMLLRDGRDAIISYAKYLKAFQPEVHKDYTEEQLITGLIMGATGYDMWGFFTRRWVSRKPSAAVLSFESLTQRPPLETLRRVFATTGVPEPEWITTEDPPSFEELHKINPKFFRQGTTGHWRDILTPAQQLLFKEKHMIPYNIGEPQCRA